MDKVRKNLIGSASFCSLLLLGMASCGGGQKPTPRGEDAEHNDSIKACVVFECEGENDSPEILVKLNGVPMTMIWDTGCEGVSISSLEFMSLIKSGKLTEADSAGTVLSIMADGSMVEEQLFHIDNIAIPTTSGDYLMVYNVDASVSEDPAALPLFGQSAMNQLPKYTMNRAKKIIEFHK